MFQRAYHTIRRPLGGTGCTFYPTFPVADDMIAQVRLTGSQQLTTYKGNGQACRETCGIKYRLYQVWSSPCNVMYLRAEGGEKRQGGWMPPLPFHRVAHRVLVGACPQIIAGFAGRS